MCPLAGHTGFGQHIVVGSTVCLLSWRCWAACQEGVCRDPIYITTEPHHGLEESYRTYFTHTAIFIRWPSAREVHHRRRPRLTDSLGQKRQQFSIDLLGRLPLEKVSIRPQMLCPGLGEDWPPDVLQWARTHGFSRPHPSGAKQE